MANILLTYCAPVIGGRAVDVCYYEGLIAALARAGNAVMRLHTNDLVQKPWNGTNALNRLVRREVLFADIDRFAPDLILAFNFSAPEGLDRRYACPFVVMEADAAAYYNDQDYLRENAGRFLFSNTGEQVLEQTIERFGVRDPARCAVIPSATAVEAEGIEQDTPISFIGTNFRTPHEALQRLHDWPGGPGFWEGLSDKEIMGAESARDRILTLDAVASLGLALYGDPSWVQEGWHFLRLAASFMPGDIYSLQHNQDIYNRSRLALNIAHRQAIDGFPWRVMDVMASNGCLLTNPNLGIAAFTKGFVDIPTYHSPAEARELAQKLLADEPWRRAIVEASQACIEAKGRWPDRLRALEAFTGVKLVHGDAARGELCFADEEPWKQVVVAAPEACAEAVADREGAPLRQVHLVDNASYSTVTSKAIQAAQEWAVRWVPRALHAPCYQVLRTLRLPVSKRAIQDALLMQTRNSKEKTPYNIMSNLSHLAHKVRALFRV